MDRCWVSQKVTSQKLFSISFRFQLLSVLSLYTTYFLSKEEE